jgi:hypothetical protein
MEQNLEWTGQRKHRIMLLHQTMQKLQKNSDQNILPLPELHDNTTPLTQAERRQSVYDA